MTMHLVRGMTSLNMKKRKAGKRSRQTLEAEARHNAWLKKKGIFKSVDRVNVNSIPSYRDARYDIPTSDAIGNGVKGKNNKYTGTYIIGIGTMHKSNSVPITNRQSARDIANMRREQ